MVVVAVGTASLMGARMLALMVQPSLALSAPTRGEDGIDVRQRGDRDRRGGEDGAAQRHRRARSGAGGHRGGQRAAQRLRAPRRGRGPIRGRGGRRRRRRRADPGPFAGVPFGVKDLEDCAGMPTTHGSLLFAGRARSADSIHVARLRAAGAVPIGKTAAPEFGTLNFTKTKALGHHPQPVGPEPHARRLQRRSRRGGGRRAGAGGTASDGGGSTRIPAAFSGLVGLKPSYGRIPHPGPTGGRRRRVRAAHHHRGRQRSPPRRDRRPRRPRPPVAAAPRWATRAIESLDVAGLRARWSADLGFASSTPRWPPWPRRGAR